MRCTHTTTPCLNVFSSVVSNVTIISFIHYNQTNRFQLSTLLFERRRAAAGLMDLPFVMSKGKY